ncbi:MerR family transcriptional regulator [Paenibacillus apiarius]|uniref:MerR family transcriptional regulator n=1 Tax=Paenibacillus apiarius TaxID=46240 RepID=A0ABT4DT05_9BACL|nr:MerR family transcriptional regulator [Paenibacillus apiarius]MCY9515732.1 MerR family transcriptional regulator [Paenibacillus apiarius]MCY9520454.1 MerR family transcriptional regulator [Paenibacillus apiarius]MCY9550587.1 MerR family transcriptional regulator [Paenibacillus apiarius]MCY9559108.1 MerR family transcriptional regulator [Paenibacillus apiarius]MCY9683097.1 MerR family transcriptional regulator [Paenibacillus apiarius]
MAYKVKEVADWVRISVRTLHHYDEIGLLKPDTVTPAGYRLYSDGNLETLQQILFFKEIGFTLEDIKRIVGQPNFDRKHALQSHRELLLKKRERLEEIIRTVERTIVSLEGGIDMEKKEMFEGFDMADIEAHQKKYAEEAREKYGRDIVDRTMDRTSKYGKDDWAAIMASQAAIYNKIIAAMDRGPADPQVQEAIGEWRRHITSNFYDCTLDVFRGLGDLYVADDRFTKSIDQYQPGLAQFMREAMHIYCDTEEKLTPADR